MKKAMLRRLRAEAEKVLGKKETEKIIKETVNEVLKETKPKTKTKKKKVK